MIVGSVLPRPRADKQRVTGLTALPVPTTMWFLWSDVSEAVLRTISGSASPERAKCISQPFPHTLTTYRFGKEAASVG